jgi:hypothetical protein
MSNNFEEVETVNRVLNIQFNAKETKDKVKILFSLTVVKKNHETAYVCENTRTKDIYVLSRSELKNFNLEDV